jgi:myo-inositol-1-phosphate synthase
MFFPFCDSVVSQKYLYSPSAYFMKHPAKQFSDDEGFRMTEAFIAGRRED